MRLSWLFTARSSRQNPPQELPETPPQSTHSSSSPPCWLWRRQAGGRRQRQRWDAAHLAAAHLAAAQFGMAPVPWSNRTPSKPSAAPLPAPPSLAGALSCWMLYKEQPGASAGSRGVKIPVTAREETSPASRCRAS